MTCLIFCVSSFSNIQLLAMKHYRKINWSYCLFWVLLKFYHIHVLSIKVWISLVVLWLRICLSMQATWVGSLIWEDPTCCWATKPGCHNWARTPRAQAPQQEKPLQWEARATWLEQLHLLHLEKAHMQLEDSVEPK